MLGGFACGVPDGGLDELCDCGLGRLGELGELGLGIDGGLGMLGELVEEGLDGLDGEDCWLRLVGVGSCGI